MILRPIGLSILCALTLPSLALAAPPDDDGASGGFSLGGSASADAGEGEPSLDTDGSASADADADADADGSADADADAPRNPQDDRGDVPWLKRWAPEPMMGELGIYGGLLLPTPNHELFSPSLDLPDQGFRKLDAIAPEIGLRAGFYPSRFFGIEGEGGVMPTFTADGAGSALLYTARGHLVGQLGLWSVTPFVLVGAGGLGVSSDRDVLGNDIDPALHFGGGVKIYLNRYVMLRLDVRDVVSYKGGVENYFISHSPEILIGLSGTLGRKKSEPKPEPEPEPEAPLDSDGDGLIDSEDSCPNEAETVNDYQDEDGCPESDKDGDGLFDDQDSCPEEPESDNGYQDEDGCPDEIPKAVRAFTGTIKGITFDNDQDTIRKSSIKTLDKAAKVLVDNPDIRIRVSGHTDNKGKHDHNVDLSKRRAESVKNYLVEKGVDASRIETEGHGPDKPIDTNDTKEGRGNNRRIDFEIILRER